MRAASIASLCAAATVWDDDVRLSCEIAGLDHWLGCDMGGNCFLDLEINLRRRDVQVPSRVDG